MKSARYHGQGVVRIDDEPAPVCPPGGLLIQTEACGLCSGELMAWYMDRKVPHVLGHEVCGRVIESNDERFPIGSRVFPHHHAPCLKCEMCRTGRFVHCFQWKTTKLVPGGMAERFAVSAENLNDAWLVDDLEPAEAALIEPLACVMKSIRRSRWQPGESAAVIGLGAMGLIHLHLLGGDGRGYDLLPQRIELARDQGLNVQSANELHKADVVFVCPGTPVALETALHIVRPEGRVVLFAPMPPGEPTPVRLHDIYFQDVELISVYSCGPNDTEAAIAVIREGKIRAKNIVSHQIELDELPKMYEKMKLGEILKPMVMF